MCYADGSDVEQNSLLDCIHYGLTLKTMTFNSCGTCVELKYILYIFLVCSRFLLAKSALEFQ